VVAMMVFHFAWDWAYVNGSSLGPGSRWYSGPIAGTFITVLGLSLALDRERVRAQGGRVGRRTLERVALLGGAALLVTAATALVLPGDFVYFGILHLLALSTLLLGLTAPLGTAANALIGLAVVLAGFAGALDGPAPSPFLAVTGWDAPRSTVDWYPLLPWAGFAFLGFAAGRLLYPHGRRRLRLPDWSRQTAPLRLLGRHALPVYLLHQLVLLPLAWLLDALAG
jgi:uncharacterized membrane protein